ncbi:hypothetical protein BDV27DRAFT_135822 [Aspergillus caelatus]|uniref:Rhodopsin domain-containing protein n=1 Tax=Aspergillus caelatus TaxID=61420 RepID=A0A5N6ZPP5_9EURO|nr:uncharacterized protein BDV27DRAFT_135822 [Aspergillus caelatus]KAE8359594.1 hypothetical protein BDV27DRAFT_135822 [Aspergillus caelatus]
MAIRNQYWGNVVAVVPTVGAALATLIYVLRLIACRMSTVGWRLEDLLMGIGLILSYGVTAFVIYTAFNGVGVPGNELPQDERIRLQFGSWMIQKFWAPSMAFVKISILVFLKRLLGTVKVVRVGVTCLIVFTMMWAFTELMGNIFQCHPVQYYYDTTLNGHCMPGQTKLFQTSACLSLVEDVIILLLPMPVVWRLRITVQQKIGLTIVFSLGALVCIFSLLRVIEFNHFHTDDLASSSAKESVWTALELNVAIICGCLPLFKPLVHRFLGKVKAQSTRSLRTPRYLNRLSQDPDGFHKISDPHGLRTSKSVVVSTDPSGRRSSDVELRGITVHTAIQQDVESRPITNSSDAVTETTWPR